MLAKELNSEYKTSEIPFYIALSLLTPLVSFLFKFNLIAWLHLVLITIGLCYILNLQITSDLTPIKKVKNLSALSFMGWSTLVPVIGFKGENMFVFSVLLPLIGGPFFAMFIDKYLTSRMKELASAGSALDRQPMKQLTAKILKWAKMNTVTATNMEREKRGVR